VDVRGSTLDFPIMYPQGIGGMNSRMIVPFGLAVRAGLQSPSFGPSYPVIAPNATVAVNIRAQIWSPGYYLFVIMPQISFDPPPPPCGGECLAGPASRIPRRERSGARPSGAIIEK